MTQREAIKKTRTVLIEFLIIVAGVLVALAVDQWKSTQADRALEAEYIERLRADLEWDIEHFGEFELILGTKASVLQDLHSEEPIRQLSERVNLLEDLLYSSFIALPANRATTFEELQSTGNLALIRNVALRGQISQYYSGFNHISQILSIPTGDYRELLSNTLGDIMHVWRLNGEEPADEELRHRLQTLVRVPGLRASINSELAYTSVMTYYLSKYRLEAEVLLNLLID